MLYDEPKYYEIAFSFRDIPFEVDLFEECFKRFSKIPVKSILELGCGNSPHMKELAKRGYEYTGVDLNGAMLEYSREKADKIEGKIDLCKADMVNFSLDTPFDFIFVALGSLYVKNTSELLLHFESIEKSLNKGGIYLLDWCIQYDFPSNFGQSWEIEINGIRVKTTVSHRYIDRVEQTFEETIVLDINDNGKERTIRQVEMRKAIFPQEFKWLIHSLEHLEFVGWWNNWDLKQPLEMVEKISRPIALIRKI